MCSFSPQRARFLHGIDPHCVFHFSVQFTEKFTITNWPGQCSLLYHEKPSRWNRKHVKDTLKLNSYPNTTLIKKPSNRTEQQFKGFAIIPYYRELTEKIRRCLSNHNVKIVLKPCNTIGKKLAHYKDSVDPNMRQGAVYQIPCHDCDFSYIGETKRSFSIRKKEHLADIRHLRFD